MEFDRKLIHSDADADSRRKSSIELIRSLMNHYEVQLTPLFMNYIETCFKSGSDWRMRETGVTLFMAIAMKGSATSVSVQSPSNQ